MFGIGSTELLVIIIVALVVLGPKSIPQIAKTVGKAVGEFRRVSTDFQRTLNAEVAREEHEENKKVAEKEFFGDSAAQPVAQTAPQVDATSTPPQAPEIIDTSTVPAETGVPHAPDHALDPTLDPDSPLARAVAKAANEAAIPSTVEPQAPEAAPSPPSEAKGTTA